MTTTSATAPLSAPGCDIQTADLIATGGVPAGLTFDYTQPSGQDALSPTERRLLELISAHRAGLGLPDIPVSRALTAVAGRHAGDQIFNLFPKGLAPGTNLHSWSDVDYFGDHRNARLMWQTPARLGTGYCWSGFEISGAGYRTPEEALAGWLSSPGHRAVIENTGIWSKSTWRAIGIGYVGGGSVRSPYDHAWHVWFGKVPDPTGRPPETGAP
ncbi:hypothetical protein JANAI62_01410 [Jannaschia pagri]|uniref:SCP domain-containing protein n=1 Tax=Jannaschia pagri TaxID=2829797 RepID=A0ABQ4NGG4_9RHOB|nr:MULTISPECIES: CAP domain-containing protein [unclassified Jannaschia]GIT90376.1 hypothetical protein JANAI61_08340 [Jannaschia sp. AI_61]GIT93518.1 hypothetical protein JANAI62_01410 [Jannaschia sp. AI_62]